MISDKINLKINPTLLVNLTFCLLPISFIFGNLITNINTLLLCVLGIFHLKSKILGTNLVETDIGIGKINWTEIPLNKELNTQNLNYRFY